MLQAVDVPELADKRNVILFSRHGELESGAVSFQFWRKQLALYVVNGPKKAVVASLDSVVPLYDID